MNNTIKWALCLALCAVLAAALWALTLGQPDPADQSPAISQVYLEPEHVARRARAVDLLFGIGQPVDTQGAADLFREGHEQGDPLSSGYLYSIQLTAERTDSVAEELDELYAVGIEFASILAAEGDSEASYIIAEVWRYYEEDPDLDYAIEHCLAAAESGFCPAQLLMGQIYEWGIGVPINLEAARRWYKLAADQDSTAGICGLGRIYTIQHTEFYDLKRGLELLEQAIARNDRFAMMHLGEMYVLGSGVESDPERGFAYLMQAAELGLPQAMLLVARCYRDGRGVEVDVAEQKKWLERAMPWSPPEAIEELKKLEQR